MLIEGLGTICIFIGSNFITMIPTYLGYRLLRSDEVKDSLINPIGPIVLFMIVSNLIGTVSM